MDRPPLTPDARTLAADLFERYATPVVGRLTRAFPAADPATVCDAFVQAVLEISQDFGRYDPAQASLENFLARATRRTLGNLLRSERRRREREQKKMSGAVTAEASADRSVLERLADRAREAAAHNEGERRALDLWLLGERDPAAYAGHVEAIVRDRALAARLAAAASMRARRYTWSVAAARLRRLYGTLTARSLVECR